MITLGVSLYPEQEKLEDIEKYLKMASHYGFTKVFTSMFSVDGSREEVIDYFKKLTALAHHYGMKVCGDCNTNFMKKMGADEKNLKVFKEMGIDNIRMDFPYHDERDALLINNAEGIGIEMSTGFIEGIEKAIENGADPERITVCHNFYPQKYSAPSLESIIQKNEYWKERNIPVAIFISSQEKGTHGPWPVSDGLPTIEEHRLLPIEVQLKHCLALKNVDEVIIVNAFASEAEMKAMNSVMKKAYIHIPYNEELSMLADILPHGDITRIPLNIHLEEGITDIEKEILLDYPAHADMGDCMNYMLRDRWPRIFYRDNAIEPRKCDKKYFTKGDVVIVNDNLKHYRGEIQIVLKDMKVDGQRNLLGRITEEEIMILDHIKANDAFTFME